jgi:hypothetical protein
MIRLRWDPRQCGDIAAWPGTPFMFTARRWTVRCGAQIPVPIFRHCLGGGGAMPHHRAVAAVDSPRLSRNSARQMTKSRMGSDGMPSAKAQHEVRDGRCGTW